MAKVKTQGTAGKRKGGARKADPMRTHDVTLKVGASIVIDPAGETLVIKDIDGDLITFEQNQSV